MIHPHSGQTVSAKDTFAGRDSLASLVSTALTTVSPGESLRGVRRQRRNLPSLFALPLLAVAVALAMPQRAFAATYYVATTGSDAATGGSGDPFRTLQHAADLVAAGDTVVVRNGTYTGTSGSDFLVSLTHSGSSGNYITFKAENKGGAILDGTGLGYRIINFATANMGYVKIQDFELRNSPGEAIKFNNTGQHDVIIKGNNLHHSLGSAAVLGSPDTLTIEENYFHDNGDNYYGGVAPNENKDHAIYSSGTNVIVRNNIFARHEHGWAMQLKGAVNWKIYNNTFAFPNPNRNGHILIWQNCSNITIRNNIFYQPTDGAIRQYDGTPSGIVVQNNLTDVANILSSDSSSTGFTISNNTVSTNPNFANPSADDFHLTSSSTAAIDHGATLAEVTTDYWGDTRPQGAAYDIGIDEYIGGTMTAPASLTATKASSPDNYRQINLSWSDVSSETGYKIERKTRVDGTYAQIATVGANAVTYSDTTCGCGTTYYYRVRAYNAGGDSAYSPEANAVTDEVADRKAHWKLNENTGTATSDTSGNGNNGTLTNGPVWTTGKIGAAVNFDGADDVVAAGSGATLDNLPAFTACAWIKADSMGGGGLARIVQKSAWSPQAGWFFFLSGTNQLGLSVDYTTPRLARTSTTNAFPTGTWCHVMVTWTGSSTATNAKIYVNGVEVSGYAVTTNGGTTRVDDSASSFFIGNDSTGVRGFDGTIDDVRVYNRVLSASELLAVYRAGL